MLIKDYKRIKKNDIKQWLLGGNAKIYGLILVVFLAAVIFVFRTVGSMFSEQPVEQEEPTVEETSGYVAENMSYKIAVNKSQNFITIYKIDSKGEFTNAVKVFRCSIGKDVPTGDTSINDRYLWHKIDENSYGHYASKLENSACIYSVPYYAQDNSRLNVSAYNNLGQPAKIGSIYLASADAKWIYENCGKRTEVTIYEDASEQPAITLGEFATVAAGTQYDPTDDLTTVNPNASNTKIGWMSGVDDCTIPLNQPFDRWAGVYAVDVNRKDITSKITITGDLDISTPGTYTLIYHLSDNFGTNLAYYRYVTVSEDTGTTQATSPEPQTPQATEAPVTPSTAAPSTAGTNGQNGTTANTQNGNGTTGGNGTGSNTTGNHTSGNNSSSNNTNVDTTGNGSVQ